MKKRLIAAFVGSPYEVGSYIAKLAEIEERFKGRGYEWCVSTDDYGRQEVNTR